MGRSLLYEKVNIHEVRDCLDDFELQMKFVCDGSLKLLIKLHDFILVVYFELVIGIFIVSLLFYDRLEETFKFSQLFINCN